MIGEIKGVVWMEGKCIQPCLVDWEDFPNEVTFKPRIEGCKGVRCVGANCSPGASVPSCVRWRYDKKTNSKLVDACEAPRTVPGPACGCCLHHSYHRHKSFINSGIQINID